MMKTGYCLLLAVFFLSACGSGTLTSVDTDETKTFITTDTIPDKRDSIRKEPVATYISLKGDKLEVKVYQTAETFQFLMKMKYKFLDEPDTLRIPNFGIQPTIVIKNGADNQSCIIGFLDKKNAFKEYKLVTVKTGNLQVKVLKRYFAGAYKTTFDDTAAARQN